MKSEGTGGRSCSGQFSAEVLIGVLVTDAKAELMPPAHCANPRCKRLFRPRAEGDIYCREACDLDSNPQYRGKAE